MPHGWCSDADRERDRRASAAHGDLQESARTGQRYQLAFADISIGTPHFDHFTGDLDRATDSRADVGALSEADPLATCR